MERTDVALGEYSVSEDGTVLTFYAGLMSSMGYIRAYKDEGGGVKDHYLTFYSTFGGLNSSLGAKNEFALELNEDDSEIYFRRGNHSYKLVLKKNLETGINLIGSHIDSPRIDLKPNPLYESERPDSKE